MTTHSFSQALWTGPGNLQTGIIYREFQGSLLRTPEWQNMPGCRISPLLSSLDTRFFFKPRTEQCREEPLLPQDPQPFSPLSARVACWSASWKHPVSHCRKLEAGLVPTLVQSNSPALINPSVNYWLTPEEAALCSQPQQTLKGEEEAPSHHTLAERSSEEPHRTRTKAQLAASNLHQPGALWSILIILNKAWAASMACQTGRGTAWSAKCGKVWSLLPSEPFSCSQPCFPC